MLCKRLIACLDVRDGRVVKGTNFVSLRDAGDPAELAARYDAEGIDEVVVLDVSATLEKRRALAATIEAVAARLFIPLTVGGGIRDLDDAAALFDAGADKISLNTAALESPCLIADIATRYGSQAVIVAIDAKKGDGSNYEVFTRSGTRATGRKALDWAREACDRGAGEILLTSIDRDGTRRGFDTRLTAEVSGTVPIPVIASGGAGSCEDFATVFTEGRADAALAASLFHYAEQSVAHLKSFLAARGIPVRSRC
jgi:cyclase